MSCSVAGVVVRAVPGAGERLSERLAAVDEIDVVERTDDDIAVVFTTADAWENERLDKRVRAWPETLTIDVAFQSGAFDPDEDVVCDTTKETR